MPIMDKTLPRNGTSIPSTELSAHLPPTPTLSSPCGHRTPEAHALRREREVQVIPW